MKRTILILAASLLLLPMAAQNPEASEYHQAPEGYKPVFNSHFGTDGYHWAESAELCQSLLDPLGDKKNLTSGGKAVLSKMKNMAKKMAKKAAAKSFAKDEYVSCYSKETEVLEKSISPLLSCSSEALGRRLFKDPFKAGDLDDLMVKLCTAASDLQDAGMGTDLFKYLTRDEILAVQSARNYRLVTVNCDVAENGGSAARAAIPLWHKIVSGADGCISSGQTEQSFRFSDHRDLLRLLSFLRLQNERGTATDLQMVFYRGDGPELVKFILNGKEAAIPAPTDIWPYYEWDKVKDFYTTREERLGHMRQLCELNTMVGTANSVLPNAGRFGKGSEERGQTIPAVLSPNGQTFWTPQTRPTEEKCSSPYHYSDSLFQGIRASHWLTGGCAQDYGSFTIAFEGGSLRLGPAGRATPFSHSDEISHPHYYSVILPKEGLRIELTGSSHSAVFRITPLRDGQVYVVLDPNSDHEDGSVRIKGKRIYGSNPVYRLYQKSGQPAGFSGHIVLECEEEPLQSGTSDGSAWVRFIGKKGEPIIFHAATSFTEEDGAELNLEQEYADFEQTASRLADTWCERMHRIDIESPDKAAVNQFYGALYRASFLPREMSDCNGAFPQFARGRTMYKSGKTYGDFSLWDTYRALHPLLTITEPTLSGEMMQSLTDMYEQAGWMPIFPCWNSFTSAMIGDHAASVIAEAYVKGIRNFDYRTAYEGLHKNAFACPVMERDYIDGKGRRAVESYWEYGFIPLEDEVLEAFHTGEQVSRTLEYAYDDWALSQMTADLGNDYDMRSLTKRALNWKNVFDSRIRSINGRHADSTFLAPGPQDQRVSWITEGAPCHYTWYVPQDVPGLIAAMGGADEFCRRLDELFDAGLYWHGNEPCHQIAYLYNLAGQPAKTRQRVREILATEYADVPGGLSGNEDAGQMSAWYIFSTLGFYPVNPASGEYVTGAPQFPKATLNLENGRSFTIIADDSAPERTTLKHSEILQGGTIRLKAR